MTTYETKLRDLGLSPEKHGQLRKGFISEARTLMERQPAYLSTDKRKKQLDETDEDLSWMNPPSSSRKARRKV